MIWLAKCFSACRLYRGYLVPFGISLKLSEIRPFVSQNIERRRHEFNTNSDVGNVQLSIEKNATSYAAPFSRSSWQSATAETF